MLNNFGVNSFAFSYSVLVDQVVCESYRYHTRRSQ
jgi:hypothetical protein